MKNSILVIAVLLAACFPLPPQRNLMLEEARSAYATAGSDPNVMQTAAASMNRARSDLQRAEKAVNDKAPQEEITHRAYLAKQHVAIARETAARERLQQSVASARIERENLLLAERAEQARAEAKAAQLAREQAEAKARAAEAARYDMEQRIRAAEAARLDALARAREAEAARQARAAAQASENAPKKALSDFNVRETTRGLFLLLPDSLFDPEKAELKPVASTMMDKLTAYLKENPQRDVLIEGYTDSLGSEEYNRYLSTERAAAVKQALLARGVPAERIRARGMGEAKPIASNETAAGREQNRRVEVLITGGGAAGRAAKDVR
jgi:outer membrane protein OmpA-like peptidoglycan-associated protein